ncbi:MAG TPA: HU family DNA-binding protein [Paludibacter sp.]|nr:HU family DNA-binding protein [Paludibacter sp.]
MNKEKITSQEIIDLVATKASVSKRAAEEFLKVMIATIEDALLAGETVKVKNFGVFKLQWNEPRKSVNVQTGEEIILAGHHKVSFAPDALLKDRVNEPFAHLEPVQLDAPVDSAEVQSSGREMDELSDPLRIFTEQASEIKNLISEIQALNSKPVDETEKFPEAVLEDEEMEAEEIEDEEVAEVEPEIVEDEFVVSGEIADDEEKVVDSGFEIADVKAVPLEKNITKVFGESELPSGSEQAGTGGNVPEEGNPGDIKLGAVPAAGNNVFAPGETVPESDSEGLNEEFFTSPFFDEVKPMNPIRGKRRYKILLGMVLLVLCVTGLYYYFPPVTRFINRSLDKSAETFHYVSQNMSMTEMMNTVSKWVAPTPKPVHLPAPKVVVVPKDSVSLDSAKVAEPVDSLQILFDQPRVYREFIATERIKSGSRLALMAQHYYGKSDFWVYIYEANMDNIPDPDHIVSGTLVRIPKIDPRLIDASNPRCIQKARELHDLYVN